MTVDRLSRPSGHSALTAALDLLQRGHWPLPLVPRGKQPHARVLLTIHGSERWGALRERRATEQQVQDWFAIDPGAGLGLIITEGLVVVDVDDPETFDIAHPATPCVRTARGWHLYFAATLRGTNRTSWGEVRGTGCYVVAPPSIHETGHAYTWTLGLDDIELARLPIALRPPARSTAHRERTAKPDIAVDHTRCPQSVAAAMLLMGRPTAIDSAGRTREIHCLLPRHPDEHPSAGLYQSANGAWRYKCHGCGANLSLASLYAAVTGGTDRPKNLSRIVARQWLLRLWHETGIATVSVDPPQIDAAVGAAARRLADCFMLLAAVRTADRSGENQLVPFAPAFAAAWCGLSIEEVQHGLAELRATGFLRPAGQSRPGIGYLYRVGDDARDLRHDQEAR